MTVINNNGYAVLQFFKFMFSLFFNVKVCL